MKKQLVILGLLLPLLVVGCSTSDDSFTSLSSKDSEISESSESSNSEKGSSDNDSSQTVAVKSVSLDRTSLQVFDDDTEAMLIATVYPEDATNKDVTWTSRNNNIATVDEDGKITPVNKGTTTITAKTADGNKTATCTVTVKEAITIPNHVMHGLFNDSSTWTDKQMVNNSYSTSEYMLLGVQLYALDEFKIHMIGDAWYGYSAIKTNAGIDFDLVEQGPSDDNIIITTTGIYNIYCDYNYDGISKGHIYLARVDTSPLPSTVNVEKIELNRSGLYMNVRDQQFDLVATVLPNNATNKKVYWTSSDTSIATVSASGKVTANRNNNKGSTTITARTEDGNKVATCIVYFSAQTVPNYYLTGTIGGYSRTSYNTYKAIPLTTKTYLIPDVQLMTGDVIYVTGQNGARLRVNTTVYEYKVTKNMTANIYLDVSKTKDYLTFEPRNN